MKIVRLQYVVLFILLVLTIGNDEIISATEKESSRRDKTFNENEIRDKSLNLIEFIIKKDIKNIINLFPEEGKVQFGLGDQYKTRKEIENGIQKEQYEYAYLFDTNKCKKYLSEFICIKDQLLELKKKNLRIKEIFLNDIESSIAYVNFTWDGKKENNSLYNFCCFVFQLNEKNKKWELASLVFHR
jgi:hypothetical protein